MSSPAVPNFPELLLLPGFLVNVNAVANKEDSMVDGGAGCSEDSLLIHHPVTGGYSDSHRPDLREL